MRSLEGVFCVCSAPAVRWFGGDGECAGCYRVRQLREARARHREKPDRQDWRNFPMGISKTFEMWQRYHMSVDDGPIAGVGESLLILEQWLARCVRKAA